MRRRLRPRSPRACAGTTRASPAAPAPAPEPPAPAPQPPAPAPSRPRHSRPPPRRSRHRPRHLHRRPRARPAPALSLPMYRAEASLYAALPGQLRESDLAMVGNLHQRMGDDAAGAGVPAASAGHRQAWGRVVSVDRDIRQAGTVSPHSSGRLSGFQAGTDLWANPQWRAGVYVGQLEGDVRVSGFARGMQNYASGANDLRSQYLGAYATWASDAGLYVDGVLQAGRHRYSVHPTAAFAGSGKGDSLLASVELGRAFAIAPRWVVEPQLQLVHQRIRLDDGAIAGAQVRQDSPSGWTMRAGLRVRGEFQAGAGTVQPYARLNVYRRSSGTDTARFIGPAAFTDIATATGGTRSELALGATWQPSPRTSVYGELGKLWASGGDARIQSGVNASVGVKLRW
ncbi:autotransporter domain-containing protein [Xenophilus sp. Marseille-Q4582]|uniref:autotransporter family protein n=1 Tax=Xenophilus sp. Marseille-Q4582 TaxID=2866600 RepID=UPI001CE3C058|nr:autotransporter outer membrane beta-barrel domain-containing protein [Xenophilus sp. Marseille-Q4582]